MTSWGDVVAAEQEFAGRVRRCFEVRKHCTMATLRQDGSPRISGIEVAFVDQDLWLGMMPGSVKARDVGRDPRLALHSPTQDPPAEDPASWAGEAKIGGRAVEVTDGGSADQGHRFRVDITEVVYTRVGEGADHLVVESWHPGRGLESVRRQ